MASLRFWPRITSLAVLRVGEEALMAIGSIHEFATGGEIPLPSVPLLEPGDRLTRAEFMRRYEAMPEIKKAELIEGVVYMPSPVRSKQHGEPHGSLSAWLGHYSSQTVGVILSDNATLHLDEDNAPQPDLMLFVDPGCGGQAKYDAKGYIEGAPELVAEIASSSVSIDLNDKLHVYRRSGVREYIAWRTLERAIDWFVLRDSEYHRLAADNDGIVKSTVFPGLWLNLPALLAGKLDLVLATLQKGLATPEHDAFARSLRPKRTGE
jgi:Uma2 family endonuclease